MVYLLNGCMFLVRFGVLHFQGGPVALCFVMIFSKHSVHGRGHRVLNSDALMFDFSIVRTLSAQNSSKRM